MEIDKLVKQRQALTSLEIRNLFVELSGIENILFNLQERAKELFYITLQERREEILFLLAD